MPRSPVSAFFIRVVFWLPVLFAVWYFMAIVATWPVAYLVEITLPSLFPELISSIQQFGHEIQTAVFFTPPNPPANAPKGMVAELVFDVNALIYGYCVPLYTALILASPSEEGEKWFRWVIGIVILQFTQAWGVSFDILKSLLFNTGPEVAAALAFEQWQMEAVALGYQFGYLILPAVTPLVIWVAFHGDFLKTLAPNIGLEQSKEH